MTIDRAARLLHAKAGELEAMVKDSYDMLGSQAPPLTIQLAADIAFVADILGWFMQTFAEAE